MPLNQNRRTKFRRVDQVYNSIPEFEKMVGEGNLRFLTWSSSAAARTSESKEKYSLHMYLLWLYSVAWLRHSHQTPGRSKRIDDNAVQFLSLAVSLRRQIRVTEYVPAPRSPGSPPDIMQVTVSYVLVK